MDSYLGNPELLDRYLVAFFASRETPEDVAKRACQWAETICQTDKVEISGFHSPVEKEVLRILLEHKHPVVLALGRSVYKRVPKEFEIPIAENRMTIISICNAVRQGWWITQNRNWTIADWADECVWAVLWMFPLTYICQKVRKSKIFHSRTTLFREKRPLRIRKFLTLYDIGFLYNYMRLSEIVKIPEYLCGKLLIL